MPDDQPTRRDALRGLAGGLAASQLAGCGGTADNPSGCRPDPGRLALLAPCMESCGPDNPRDEWDHSCLHPKTRVYSCGRPVAPGRPDRHDHPPGEVDLCRRLATAAAPLLAGIDAVGSESSDPYEAFFLVANRGDEPPDAITPDLVRRLFGGAIYPAAEIEVEPLAERGRWWRAVLSNHGLDPDGTPRRGTPTPTEIDRTNAALGRWRALIAWFAAHPDLRGASYVAIGEEPLGPVNSASLFPRLLVGLPRAGSLVGLGTHVVHT